MSIPNLIIKPPQGQKTVEALDIAQRALQSHPETLIVFVCGNSKAQGDQVLSRANARFSFGCLLLHSHAFSSSHIPDVLGKILQGTRFIVSLANATRLQTVSGCLDRLLQDPNFRLVIFVDEADLTYRAV